MSGTRQRGPWRVCLTLSVALWALIGCRTSPPRSPLPGRAPPTGVDTPRVGTPGDASYDWHGLLVAPFGAVLKSVPMALHEVLLFRDDEQGSDAADTAAAAAECYATDEPAPDFFGRPPDEYLLCFTHDRLSRVQATVRLATAEASAEFAAACAVWLKNAAAAVSTTDAPNAAACEGSDGAVHFKGSLGEEPEPADMADMESVVSIALDSPPGP